MISVRACMTSPAVTLGIDASRGAAMKLLEQRRLSALAIVDAEGELVGVLSTTDLVRALAEDTGDDASIASLVSSPPLIATPDEPIDEAAWRLVAARAHRLVVVEHGRPIGVLSARDILREVARRLLATPIREIMTAPVDTIDVGVSIAEATTRLAAAGVHGLVVVDGGRPLGMFTHAEAMDARRLGRLLREDPVEEVMSENAITLDPATPVHLAAEQVIRAGVDRILVVEGHRLLGIASVIDLVGVLARAPENDAAEPAPARKIGAA